MLAGTTRDVVKEQVILNGIPITLVDTGLRQSSDVVEQHGMARVAQEINQADDLVGFRLFASSTG